LKTSKKNKNKTKYIKDIKKYKKNITYDKYQIQIKADLSVFLKSIQDRYYTQNSNTK